MTIFNCAEISSNIQDIFCKTNIYYSLLVYNETLVTNEEIQTLCEDLRGQDLPLFIINESCGEIQEQEVNEIVSQYRMFVIPQYMFCSWVNMQGWCKVIEDVSIVFCLFDSSYDVQRTLDDLQLKTSDDLCLIPL
jgi:hypothetical protein